MAVPMNCASRSAAKATTTTTMPHPRQTIMAFSYLQLEECNYGQRYRPPAPLLERQVLVVASTAQHVHGRAKVGGDLMRRVRIAGERHGHTRGAVGAQQIRVWIDLG